MTIAKVKWILYLYNVTEVIVLKHCDVQYQVAVEKRKRKGEYILVLSCRRICRHLRQLFCLRCAPLSES